MAREKENKIIFIILSITICIAIIGSSFALARYRNKVLMNEVKLRANTVTELVMLFRSWLLEQKAVYVKDAKGYHIAQEKEFYKKAPANVIHEISDSISNKNIKYSFRVVSLKPTNRNNYPKNEELEALKSFQSKSEIFSKTVNDNGKYYYYYVIPLTFKEACIKCHSAVGVKINEQGGLAVKIDITEYIKLMAKNYYSNLIMAALLSALLVFLVYKVIYLKIEAKISNYAALAKTDSLTGLYNHSTFMEIIEELLKNKNSKFGIIIADLDDFKKINDTYGHQAGDYVLKEVATLFSKEFRDTDIIARYGGEEFAMILPNTDPDTVQNVAERIRKNIQEMQLNYLGEILKITISIGLANYPKDVVSKDELISHADKNLYYAKNHGKNQIGFSM